MENNFDTFAENAALFDAYIRGEMSPEQRAAFEARLVEPSLRSDFDLHRALLGSIERNLERTRLREQVQEARQAAPTREEPARPMISKWIAALLLLLVAGGLYFLLKPNPKDPSEKTRLHQDSLPARDSTTHQPSNKPGDTIQQNAKKQANNKKAPFRTPVGAASPDSFRLEIPIISTRAGQPRSVTLTVFEDDDGGLWSNRSGRHVQLSVSKNYFDRDAGFKFYELEIAGNLVFYLRMGADFYAIPLGDSKMEPETDEAALVLLKQF